MPTANAILAQKDVNLYVADGVITINGSTHTADGDILVKAWDEKNDQNIVITHDGKLDSGHDLTLHTYNGGINVTDNTVAQRNLNVIVDNKGSVYFKENVDVTGTVSAEVKEGDITIGKTIKSGQGIDMKTGSGTITVGQDVTSGATVNLTSGKGNITVGDKTTGTGNVTANGNVNLTVTEGNIDIVKKVASENGNVTAKADQGDIWIGSNGPEERTVYAQGDIDMSVTEGIIRIQGKTETADGDISMQAHNEQDNQNIVIEQDGMLDSGRDLTLHVYNGDINVTDNTVAKQNLNVIVDNEGSVHFQENVDVIGAVSAEVKDGDITIGKTIKSGQRIDMKTGSGNITVGQDVTSGTTVNLTSDKGNITVGDKTTGAGNVTANDNVSLTVTEGNIDIVKTVVSENGNVTAKADQGDIRIGSNGPEEKTVYAKGDIDMSVTEGIIRIQGKTETADGDISMQAHNEQDNQNIVIEQDGKLVSGRDLTLHVYNGDIEVTDKTLAGKDFYAIVDNKGNISFERDVTTTGDLVFEVDDGDVTINHTVTSTEGSINISSREGNIRIGDNGPTDETVTAKENVSLVTENGKIEVYGKTSTENGDITLKAANPQYIAGTDGQNIIIDHNGQIDSGQDATLIAKNGDLHVTDKVWAKRNLKAITQNQGDVFMDDDLTVKDSVYMMTDTGDIFADRNVKAPNGGIVAATGDGDITVGTADAKYVSLTGGGENGHVHANAIYAKASGNSNGTGLEDVKLGGSYVNIDTVVNKSNGSTPLTIATLGPDEDKPIKDINIGKQNADLSYSGGIQSASGAVIQQLWADRGLVYMADNSNLHMSKLVVNEKLHVVNDTVSVGVFGVPPYHDGAQVVYWNDAEKKNPSGMLDRWYNGS